MADPVAFKPWQGKSDTNARAWHRPLLFEEVVKAVETVKGAQ